MTLAGAFLGILFGASAGAAGGGGAATAVMALASVSGGGAPDTLEAVLSCGLAYVLLGAAAGIAAAGLVAGPLMGLLAVLCRPSYAWCQLALWAVLWAAAGAWLGCWATGAFLWAGALAGAAAGSAAAVRLTRRLLALAPLALSLSPTRAGAGIRRDSCNRFVGKCLRVRRRGTEPHLTGVDSKGRLQVHTSPRGSHLPKRLAAATPCTANPDYSRKVTVILSAAKNLLMCDESRSFAALRMTGMVLLGEVNDSVLRTTSCIKTRPVDE